MKAENLTEVSERASRVRFTHVLATVVASVFYGFGFVLGKAWYLIVWCSVAVAYGFCDAAKPSVRPAQRSDAPEPEPADRVTGETFVYTPKPPQPAAVDV